MNTELDDKLYELQKACRRHSDPLADWVLFAISRHINTGRATPAFIRGFIAVSEKDFPDMITRCLNGDRSDNGIMKTAKKYIREIR